MNPPRLTAYLLLLIVSVIWGVAGPVIKFSLHDFPPLIFLSYRFTISTLVALLFFTATRTKLPRKPKQWETITAYSILAVTLGLGLLFFGFDKTTSLTGSLLSSLAPMATVIAGAWFLREHVTKVERIGISIALVGTLVTIVGPLWLNGGNRQGAAVWSLEGNMLIVASIVVDTWATLLVKTALRQGISGSVLTHLSFVIGLVTIGPAAIATHGASGIFTALSRAPLSAHLGVWYMALISGTLAYTLRNIAVKSIEVSEVAVFAYLYPLFAAPLAIFWLGEPLTVPFLVGAGLIATGVVIAEYKRRRKPQRHTQAHRHRH